MRVCVCAPYTNFLPGAGDSDAVCPDDLGCRVSTRSSILSEAQVIIGAQVNHILHCATCVPERHRGGGIKDMMTDSKVMGSLLVLTDKFSKINLEPEVHGLVGLPYFSKYKSQVYFA